MSTLKNRIKKLESVQSEDGLVVIIIRWARSSDYEEIGRVSYGESVIERNAKETEDDFMKKAESQLQQVANSSQKPITAFAEFTHHKIMGT